MSNRRDTCIGKRCSFWTRYGDTCPNFVEGQWKTVEGHEYATKDCAPKRSMILCQQIYDHMLNVRRDYGTVRNANEKVLKAMEYVINPQVTITVPDAELIEDTQNGKNST